MILIFARNANRNHAKAVIKGVAAPLGNHQQPGTFRVLAIAKCESAAQLRRFAGTHEGKSRQDFRTARSLSGVCLLGKRRLSQRERNHVACEIVQRQNRCRPGSVKNRLTKTSHSSTGNSRP